MTTVTINPSLVYRDPLAPAPPCCARTSDRHRFGCRYWAPRPDWDRFFVEIAYGDGVTSGNFVHGGRALGQLLLRLAQIRVPWRYTVIFLEGNYLDVGHGYLVQRRKVSVELFPRCGVAHAD